MTSPDESVRFQHIDFSLFFWEPMLHNPTTIQHKSSLKALNNHHCMCFYCSTPVNSTIQRTKEVYSERNLGSHGHVSAPHIKLPSAKRIPKQNFQDYTITWSVDDVEEKRLSFGVRQNNSHWCALNPYSPLKDRKPGLSVKRKKSTSPCKDIKDDKRKVRKMERSKHPSRTSC